MQSTHPNRVLRPGAMRAATAPPLPPRGSKNKELGGIEDGARYAQLNAATQAITISTHRQDRPENVLGHPQMPQTVLTLTLSAPQTIAFAIGGAQLGNSSLVPSHNSAHILLNPLPSLTNTKWPFERPFQAAQSGKKECDIPIQKLPRQRGDSKDFPITLVSPCKRLPNALDKQATMVSRPFRDGHSPISTNGKGKERSKFVEHCETKNCTTSRPNILESKRKLQPPPVTEAEHPDRGLSSISQQQSGHSRSRSDVAENEPDRNNSRTEQSGTAGKQLRRISTADSQPQTGNGSPSLGEEPSQNEGTQGQVATHSQVIGTNYEPRSAVSGVAVHVPKRKQFDGEAQPRYETKNKKRRVKGSDMSTERRNFLKDVYKLFAPPATMEKQIITSSDQLPEDAGQSLLSIELPELSEDTESTIGRGVASTPALGVQGASCTATERDGSTVQGSMREPNRLRDIDRDNLYQKMRITEPTRTPTRGDEDFTSVLPTFEDSPCEFSLDPLDAVFPDELPQYKSGTPRNGTYSSTQRSRQL